AQNSRWPQMSAFQTKTSIGGKHRPPHEASCRDRFAFRAWACPHPPAASPGWCSQLPQPTPLGRRTEEKVERESLSSLNIRSKRLSPTKWCVLNTEETGGVIPTELRSSSVPAIRSWPFDAISTSSGRLLGQRYRNSSPQGSLGLRVIYFSVNSSSSVAGQA